MAAPRKGKKAKRSVAAEIEPERTNRRRALTHVGGKVQFTGRDELKPALVEALSVRADEKQTRRHVHGFHSYPARLHPDTARTLIDAFSSDGGVVLDPFCGSGSVVVEARLAGRSAIGRDVNPLAVALCKLKSRGSNERERKGWRSAAEAVAAESEQRRLDRAAPSQLYDKNDLDLFEVHVLLELDNLRLGIHALDDAQTRRVLHLCLSSILTKVSRRHGDSSRKQSERRLPSGYTTRIFEARVDELLRQLAAFEKLLPQGAKTPDVKKDDARELKTVEPASVDLVVTSPPYPGVYDYFDHHAARLRWLKMDARAFKASEIGSRRELNTLSGKAAVSLWEEDFGRALQAIKKTVRPSGLMIFVVADTAVSGQVIDGAETTARLAQKVGLTLVASASQRRPQFHFSSSKAFGQRQRREHLIVLER